jgi:hypothetical protein
MNVIAYDYAYSAYPWATFNDRVNLKTLGDRRDNDRDLEAILKYEIRGWNTLTRLNPDAQETDPETYSAYRRRAFTNRSRWLNDRSSWTIQLSTQGVRPPPRRTPLSEQPERDLVYCTNWSLYTIGSPRLIYYIAHGTWLAQKYVFVDDELISALREGGWRLSLAENEKEKTFSGLFNTGYNEKRQLGEMLWNVSAWYVAKSVRHPCAHSRMPNSGLMQNSLESAIDIDRYSPGSLDIILCMGYVLILHLVGNLC